MTSDLYKYFLAVALFLVNFNLEAQTLMGCGLLKDSVKLEKELHHSEVQLRKGTILPILKRTENSITLYHLGRTFDIDSAKVKVGPPNLCKIRPFCFLTKVKAPVYFLPTTKSPTYRVSKKNYKWSAVAKRSIKRGKSRRRWVQVTEDSNYFWVKAKAGQITDEHCDIGVKDSSLFFSARTNFVFNQSPIEYNNLITEIPDPTNVSCEQNPIYTSVDPGGGFNIGLDGYYRINSNWGIGAGVHYEKLTYRLNFRDNPHPDPGNTSCHLFNTSVSELSENSLEIEEQSLRLPLKGNFLWTINNNHHLLFGAVFEPFIYIDNTQFINYYTGQTLSKNTKNTKLIEVEGLANQWGLEFSYLYNFPFETKDSYGLNSSITLYQKRISLGLAMIF